jgi:hypothetical protein
MTLASFVSLRDKVMPSATDADGAECPLPNGAPRPPPPCH